MKRGKHTAVKGKGQKCFIRFRTLGTGYGEDEIKAERRERQSTSRTRRNHRRSNRSSF